MGDAPAAGAESPAGTAVTGAASPAGAVVTGADAGGPAAGADGTGPDAGVADADAEGGSPVTTVIARTVVRTVLPLVVVTAVALLLQGHNLPGGGFIAGVLTAAGIALVYVIYGGDYLASAVLGAAPTPSPEAIGHGPVVHYRTAFALGLALAAGSGLVPLAFGHPFLTQGVGFVELPLYGELEVATALAFDLGVYLTVVGALLTVVAVVGHE